MFRFIFEVCIATTIFSSQLASTRGWKESADVTLEYADPCKAAAYLGDIALTEEDVKLFRMDSTYENSFTSTPSFPPHKTTVAPSLYITSPSLNNFKRKNRYIKLLKEKNKSRKFRNLKFFYKKHNSRANLRKIKKIRNSLEKEKTGKRYKNVTGHRKKTKKEKISLSTDKSRSKRAATARKERLWEHGIIPYEIEANFSGSNKMLFMQAMRHWENHTCLTFVRRTPAHHNYILFTEKPCGCCSFVGRRGNGVQAISIGKNCDKFGIVVHELGHVIGFWHEHTRPDRDAHVQIIFKHIMHGQEYNFNTLTPNEVNSLNESYDFNSIMHYARNTFSRSTHLDTILPLDKHLRTHSEKDIGQRVELSEGDIKQANKLYKCPTCGRTLQETSGHFGFWWYKHSRYKGVCQWRISGTHGEVIQLNLTHIDFPFNSDCSNDHIEIRDGYWANAPLIGKFCSYQPHSSYMLMSTDNRMWVQYQRSKLADNSHGFRADYKTICGGKIAKESGIITSPFYPEFYKNDKNCSWVLMVPEDFTVALKFHSFEVEHHNECVYDYVEVRDGRDHNSELLGRFCGSKLPPDIKSSSNWMYVEFLSDTTVGKNGFAATFVKEIDECLSDDHGCKQICNNTLGGYHCSCYIGYQLHSNGRDCEENCGGLLHFSNGSIQSPSYPNNYPSDKYCEWEIVATEGFQITLEFTEFNLEGNNHDCDYDSVVVKSESENESKMHGTFCGSSLPPLITSISNKMRVIFKTDQNTERRGFHANFVTDQDECATNNGNCRYYCKNTIGSYECSCPSGYILHTDKHDCKESECKHEMVSQESILTSLNYPDFYPNSKRCTWLFASTPGHRIRIRFMEFEIENHSQCNYDYVALYDGPNASFPLIKMLCGNRKEESITASSNVMFIVFESDPTSNFKGFYAKQDTVCGGQLLAMPKPSHFFSHAKYGDVDYEDGMYCVWKITSIDNSRRVKAKFVEFLLEEEHDCSYDSVEVYEGDRYNQERMIDKYCKREKLPKVFHSRTSTLIIKFKTDESITTKGFRVSFMISQRKSKESKEAMLKQKKKRQHSYWQRYY